MGAGAQSYRVPAGRARAGELEYRIAARALIGFQASHDDDARHRLMRPHLRRLRACPGGEVCDASNGVRCPGDGEAVAYALWSCRAADGVSCRLAIRCNGGMIMHHSLRQMTWVKPERGKEAPDSARRRLAVLLDTSTPCDARTSPRLDRRVSREDVAHQTCAASSSMTRLESDQAPAAIRYSSLTRPARPAGTRSDMRPAPSPPSPLPLVGLPSTSRLSRSNGSQRAPSMSRLTTRGLEPPVVSLPAHVL